MLTFVRSELGCCINLSYNTSTFTFYTPDAFSNALWENCGVEPVTEESTASPIRLQSVEADPKCNLAEEA